MKWTKLPGVETIGGEEDLRRFRLERLQRLHKCYKAGDILALLEAAETVIVKGKAEDDRLEIPFWIFDGLFASLAFLARSVFETKSPRKKGRPSRRQWTAFQQFESACKDWQRYLMVEGFLEPRPRETRYSDFVDGYKTVPSGGEPSAFEAAAECLGLTADAVKNSYYRVLRRLRRS